MDNYPFEVWKELHEAALATTFKLFEQPDQYVIPVEEFRYVIQVDARNVAMMPHLRISNPEIESLYFSKKVVVLDGMGGIANLDDVVHRLLGGEVCLPVVIRHWNEGGMCDEWYL